MKLKEKVKPAVPPLEAGVYMAVCVTVSEDGAHNNIEDVMALPKGLPAPQSGTAPLTYDIDRDGFSGAVWDSLPPWMREAVEKSEQYRQDPPDKPLDMPPEDAPAAGPQPQQAAQEGACPI